MKLLLRALLLLVIAIAGTVISMLSVEDDYIFFPEQEMSHSPADAGLSFRDLYFTSADGVRLHGWYMPHPHARFTLLHLHGNAGNISHRVAQYRRWHEMGLAVFAFDYRGFGLSEGEPSEDGLYDDAMAAWSLLQEKPEMAGNGIIIAGRSLGCAVAAHLASEVKPAGLALETPFTSLPDMSAAAYPWLPLRWFVRNQFDTLSAVASLQAPLLLISAESDEIIPADMPDRVFAAAHPPKLRGSFPGKHNDFDYVSARPYTRLWLQWLHVLASKRQPAMQWVMLEQP
ncbi:alpha/beta hydrolase [Mariprofundus erugo]|nr:alpha/beta hydrolase [Mariprofundus erugo]